LTASVIPIPTTTSAGRPATPAIVRAVAPTGRPRTAGTISAAPHPAAHITTTAGAITRNGHCPKRAAIPAITPIIRETYQMASIAPQAIITVPASPAQIHPISGPPCDVRPNDGLNGRG